MTSLPQDSGKEKEVGWLAKVVFARYMASVFVAEKVGDLGRNRVAECHWWGLCTLPSNHVHPHDGSVVPDPPGTGYYWHVQGKQRTAQEPLKDHLHGIIYRASLQELFRKKETQWVQQAWRGGEGREGVGTTHC